ncbi:MAG: hypothetical protein ABEJ93_03040 [Candidatus Nanohalobium sp.]
MSKGLGVKIIGSMVLALVGVSVLITAFTSNTSGLGGVYCSTYESLSTVFPGKDSPPPQGCGEQRTVKYQAVEAQSVSSFNFRLANAVLNCWDRYRGYNTSKFCQGWNVKSLPKSVDEANFTKTLENNNLCPESIENGVAEYGSETCGSENQLYFNKAKIEEGDFIVIKYNTSASGTQHVVIN